MNTMVEEVQLTRSDVLNIDRALWLNKPKVTVNGQIYNILSSGGVRRVKIGNILFKQQDPESTNELGLTSSALKAREGVQITWGIKEGRFIHVENGRIIHF